MINDFYHCTIIAANDKPESPTAELTVSAPDSSWLTVDNPLDNSTRILFLRTMFGRDSRTENEKRSSLFLHDHFPFAESNPAVLLRHVGEFPQTENLHVRLTSVRSVGENAAEQLKRDTWVKNG